jgi:hypothetical protein
VLQLLHSLICQCVRLRAPRDDHHFQDSALLRGGSLAVAWLTLRKQRTGFSKSWAPSHSSGPRAGHHDDREIDETFAPRCDRDVGHGFRCVQTSLCGAWLRRPPASGAMRNNIRQFSAALTSSCHQAGTQDTQMPSTSTLRKRWGHAVAVSGYWPRRARNSGLANATLKWATDCQTA